MIRKSNFDDEPYHEAGSEEPVRERGRALYWWPSFASPDQSAEVGRKMITLAILWLVGFVLVVVVTVLLVR